MDALLYFLLWAGLIFMMLRFGCGAHVLGHGGRKSASDDAGGQTELRWIPPESDTDPVCGRTVITDKARPSVHDGNVYYFCSRECRDAFEAAPDAYLGSMDADSPQMEKASV